MNNPRPEWEPGKNRIMPISYSIYFFVLVIGFIIFLLTAKKVDGVSYIRVSAFACFILIMVVGILTLQNLGRRMMIRNSIMAKKASKDKETYMNTISTLCSDYSSVYVVDLENDVLKYAKQLDVIEEIYNSIPEETRSISSFAKIYADTILNPDEASRFLKECSKENIIKHLEEYNRFSFIYLSGSRDNPQYYRMSAVKSDSLQNVIIGFENVDYEVRKEMESKKMLESSYEQVRAANETKNKLLANMSHELLTPINIISGMGQLLSVEKDNPDSVLEYSEEISKQSNVMAGLVRTILSMSSISNGEMMLSLENLSIIDLFNNVVNECTPDAQKSKVTLSTNLDIHCEKVKADKEKITIMFREILENAIAYSGVNSTVEVNLHEISVNPNTSLLEFSVHDNGAGIDERILKTIYEPFVRAKDTTESGIPGFGIGLSIVKYIVDILNGDIKIDSSKGKGTTVVIRFSLLHD